MKTKAKSPNSSLPDFPRSYLRRKEIWHAANRFGFVGILEDGKRVAYLVTHKFWQNDTLQGGIVAITSYGKVKGYVVNATVWNVFISFLRCVTPAQRHRLPKIAALVARRYMEEGKKLGIQTGGDEQIAR